MKEKKEKKKEEDTTFQLVNPNGTGIFMHSNFGRPPRAESPISITIRFSPRTARVNGLCRFNPVMTAERLVGCTL